MIADMVSTTFLIAEGLRGTKGKNSHNGARGICGDVDHDGLGEEGGGTRVDSVGAEGKKTRAREGVAPCVTDQCGLARFSVPVSISNQALGPDCERILDKEDGGLVPTRGGRKCSKVRAKFKHDNQGASRWAALR